MRTWLALVGCLLAVAACGTASPASPAYPASPATPLVSQAPTPGATPSAASSPSPSAQASQAAPTATHAEAEAGEIRLAFDLPKAIWRAGEPILGTSTLSFEGSGSVALSGSGQGPFGFAIAEVPRDRAIGPAWTDDCVSYSLPAGKPMTSGIRLSGGWEGSDPNAAFYYSLMTAPALQLPAGTWDITAYGVFIPAPGCGAAEVHLTATLRILVTD